MSLLVIVGIGGGGALLTVVAMLVLAACKVDGFYSDKPRHEPTPSFIAEPVPTRQRQPQGPLRVPSRRLDQVEAA